jgi:hypothetical protein
MLFYLVNPAGEPLASTLISVRCGSARSSWFPLDTGNEWTYFTKSRQHTGGYSTMRVASSQILNGELWFTIDGGPFSGALLREEEEGRILAYRPATPASPQLVFDPTTTANPAALYPTRPGTVVYSASGPTETLTIPFIQIAALDGRTGTLGKNVGLLDLTSTVIAGSSGGFGFGYSLIRARINGKLVYDTPEASLTLGVESQRLTLRPGLVPNCAVPCYFTACGLVPGADPPDTFKPCARARLTLSTPLPASATAQVRLSNSSGEIVFQISPSELAPGASSLFLQLPLYTAPNQPLPPGAYLLTGTVVTPAGTMTSTLPLELLP